MKILTLQGSPRKQGNTATALGWFEDRMRQAHTVEQVTIRDIDLSGCLGCLACQKVLDAPGCVRRDDGTRLLKQMMASDVIVYATPLYAWSFTAQLKALFDRQVCMVKWQDGQCISTLLENKLAALLITCADAVEDNADLLPIIFQREMNYLHCQAVGSYVIPHCTTPDQLGEQAQQTVEAMAVDILAALNPTMS